MSLTDRLPALMRTALEMAKLEGASLDARVLGEARASLVQSGYDNWDGGTDLYTLVLELPVQLFVEITPNQAALEISVGKRIALQTRVDTGESVSEVVIAPRPVENAGALVQTSDAAIAEEEPIPAFWQPGYFRLFISHLAENKLQAHALKDALARYQIAAFVAHEDIEPSAEWQNEIESALRTMDALLAMLVPSFISSRWCDQEVGYALGRRRFVLGLRMGADPHGFLGKYQGLAVAGLDAPNVARMVFDILVSHEVTTQRMTESLVERLVRSSSWDASKHTMTLLEKSKSLNSGQIARLLSSIEENIDVGQAFGVPERIRSLLQRIGPQTP